MLIAPSWTVAFSEDFPKTVVANNYFNVSLNIVDMHSTIVDHGFDSVAMVALRIAEEYGQVTFLNYININIYIFNICYLYLHINTNIYIFSICYLYLHININIYIFNICYLYLCINTNIFTFSICYL